MDAVLLMGLVREWRTRLLGARLDRVTTPAEHRAEFVFFTRAGEATLAFLLVSQAAQVYMPDRPMRQGDTPTAFAMLLRRRLAGFRVVDIPSPDLERVLAIRLQGRNELGDEEVRTLIFEGFGPRPNLVLVGADGRIVDAYRRTAPDPSGQRGRLPGLVYDGFVPGSLHQERAGGGREDPRCLSLEGIVSLVHDATPEGAHQALTRRLRGISPLWAREVLACLTLSPDAGRGPLGASLPPHAAERWQMLQRIFDGDAPAPGVAFADDGTLLGAFPLPPRQFGTVRFERSRTLTEAVTFAVEREAAAKALATRRAAVLREVRRRAERLRTRLARQEEEWAQAESDLALRDLGELLLANAYRIPPGTAETWLEDWGHAAQNGPDAPWEPARIHVVLDPSLTPAAFAERLFARYQKARRRKAALAGELEQGRRELAYLADLEDAARRAEDAAVLDAVAREVEAAGGVHPARPKDARKAAKSRLAGELPFAPLRYRGPRGAHIWVGRTGRENDRLTLHEARPDDMWLHVADGPGAHVIVRAEGRSMPDDADLVAAAEIAAFHSPQARGSHVEVVACRAGRVRRAPGGRPGLVLYDRERSFSVTPDPVRIAALRVEDDTVGKL